MAVGRISGPLLKANLERQGIDLAFETDLLYLDVNNNRVGIKTTNPQYDLDVNGTTRTTNLRVTNRADIGDVNIQGNTISSDVEYLNLGTLDNVVYQTRAIIDSITLQDNVISSNESNANIEFRPNGTGTVDIFTDLNVTGNIHATGNIQLDGNLIIGDSLATDTVTVNAEVASDIVPDITNTYQLGTDPTSGGKQWRDIWTQNLTAGTINADVVVIDGVDLTLRQGNIWYVAENGNDSTFTGDHPQNPYGSLTKALSSASAGDTIYIYPGVYNEAFPLTVPAGVTVKGYQLRGVNIKPTYATRYNDAFLLNGESTVEDITISDFYSGGKFFEITGKNSDNEYIVDVGTAPFAHTYVSGGLVRDVNESNWNFDATTRNITNATYNHTTGSLVVTLDGNITGSGIGDYLFLSDLTFSCNSDTRVFPDNGYAFRFATDFEVTSRSPYIKNITVITAGSTTTAEDPRGFNAGDAGKGAYIDGAYATANSKEASMLFHSSTFITPGVDAITATNGARIEWLNSFTYFANRSIYAFDSNDGLKGDGKTALRVTDLTGSFSAGETVTYYDTDGTTVIATGTIETKDADNKFYIDGKVTGFVNADTRQGKSITANGNAQLSTSVKKFGTASLALDGTGDYASIAAQDDFGLGTGDFTIEAWVYADTGGLTGTRSIIDMRAGVASDTGLYIYQTGGVAKVYYNGAEILSGGTLSVTTWTHVAVTRSGTTITLYVDGTSVDTDGAFGSDLGSSKPMIIGANYDGSTEYWDGYFDDIRVIKGSSVTPPSGGPTSSVSVTSDTVLMARFNGSNGSTTFEDDVVYAQDIRFSGGATAEKFVLTDYTDFGAEIRLIGSASVYGNFGLVGDGPGVIMYAIGHNVAYIGNGKEVTNDPYTVIQENEIVETNDAKIRYNTVDHNGDFRVGNQFYVNQADGTVEFSAANFNIEASDGFTFTDGATSTIIDGTKVQTGNLKLSGNTLESLTGPVNIESADDVLNLNNDVNITGDLDVTGDVTIGGNITLGDQDTDNIEIIAGVASDIIPNINSEYDLGSITNYWANLYVSRALIDDIEINTNYIQTIASNADLELRANGTGRIYVPSNNLQIDNDLTVLGEATLGDTDITGLVTIDGSIVQTGDTTVNGDVDITGAFTVGGAAQFENILIDDNFITTTLSNSDLELRANGTGVVRIPENDVEIANNLTVEGTFTVGNITTNGDITADNVTVNDNLSVGGAAQFEEILVDDNFITTTSSNADLELRAAGTGEVYVPNNDVRITNNLTVNGTITVGNINSTKTISANRFDTGDILIDDNRITTTLSNSNLELRAAGTGNIVIDDLSFNDDTITSTGDIVLQPGSQLVNIDSTGAFNIPVGDTSQRPASSAGQIRFNTDLGIFEGYDGSDWIQLHGVIDQDRDTRVTAELTQGANDNVIRFYVENNIIVDIDNNRLNAPKVTVDDIQIDGNQISTITTDTDLVFSAQGTGSVVFDNFAIKDNTITNTVIDSNTIFQNTGSGYVKIDGTKGFAIPIGTTLERPAIAYREAGMIRFNTDDDRVEVFDGASWIGLGGAGGGITYSEAEGLAIEYILTLG